MQVVTFVFGACLVVLGLVGYFASGRASWTALIPAIAGAIFLMLGAVALNPRYRRHAMHAAAALAVLGLVATLRGVIKVFQMYSGTEIERPQAAISQAIMAALCLVFVSFAVRSFVMARRQRPGQGFEPTSTQRE